MGRAATLGHRVVGSWPPRPSFGDPRRGVAARHVRSDVWTPRSTGETEARRAAGILLAWDGITSWAALTTGGLARVPQIALADLAARDTAHVDAHGTGRKTRMQNTKEQTAAGLAVPENDNAACVRKR